MAQPLYFILVKERHKNGKELTQCHKTSLRQRQEHLSLIFSELIFLL